MNTYKAAFCGRKVGADGIRYLIETTVEADNKESANLRLYDQYEHISDLKLVEIPQQPPTQ